MAGPSYLEKLKDPRWQKKRLAVLEHAEFKCQLCGNGRKPLHVHHSYYSKGKMPWQYPLGSLIALCETHHSLIHDLMRGLLARRALESVRPAFRIDPPATNTAAKSHFARMRQMVQESLERREGAQ